MFRMNTEYRSHLEQFQTDNNGNCKEIEKLLLSIQRKHNDEMHKLLNDTVCSIK